MGNGESLQSFKEKNNGSHCVPKDRQGHYGQDVLLEARPGAAASVKGLNSGSGGRAEAREQIGAIFNRENKILGLERMGKEKRELISCFAFPVSEVGGRGGLAQLGDQFHARGLSK